MIDVPENPLIVSDPTQHTMGYSLPRYVEMRTHEFVDEMQYDKIRVLGLYGRTKGVSRKEKNDKLENWQRPTAELVSEELRICCYPARAYVFHYASLIATHLALTGRDPNIVRQDLPSERECERAISEAGYSALEPSDVLIVCSGVSQLTSIRNFADYGLFKAKQEMLGKRSVTWLIVKHSFWGDIAHWLGSELAKRGFRTVLFVGKLGSLDSRHVPNETLATGNESTIDGQHIEWVNFFRGLNESEVVEGTHITVPSVLQETLDWRAQVAGTHTFVDPEIGNLATGVLSNGARFSYLHIVSDNLGRRFTEDLSNERVRAVERKRRKLYLSIKNFIETRLQSAIW